MSECTFSDVAALIYMKLMQGTADVPCLRFEKGLL